MTVLTKTHPGEYIKEEIEARGWSQRDLAFILGCPEPSINTILAGKRGISAEMAKALAKAFDVSPEFFASLQKSYDLSQAQDPNPEVEKRAKMQTQYPVREMIKRGWIELSDANLLEQQLVEFFEVNSYSDIPYLQHAAKKSESTYEKRNIPPAQLAWLFRVKQIARSISVPPYSERALRESLEKMKSFLFAPEEARHVPRILMECGVRFVIVELLPQAKIDGVCFWLNKKAPVIGMSMRFDRIDNFWFVLRHEIEHILRKDGMEEEILDDLESDNISMDNSVIEQERAANIAASEFCISSQKLNEFLIRKKPFYAEKDVVAFASLNGVHPGIVVGQMHNRWKDRYDYLRKYLVRVRQFVLPGAIADGWDQRASIKI